MADRTKLIQNILAVSLSMIHEVQDDDMIVMMHGNSKEGYKLTALGTGDDVFAGLVSAISRIDNAAISDELAQFKLFVETWGKDPSQSFIAMSEGFPPDMPVPAELADMPRNGSVFAACSREFLSQAADVLNQLLADMPEGEGKKPKLSLVPPSTTLQ